MKINILQCHHKESEYLKNKYIQPIHVGSALSDRKLDYCIRDDEGENISNKNKNWCELTALYWQWKNVDADYYGLFHYRRILSFKNGIGVYNEESFSDKVIGKHGLSEKYIKDVCLGSDIITAPYFNIHPAGLVGESLTAYQFYCRDHYQRDIDKLLEICRKNNNEFYIAFKKTLNEKTAFFGNIQIMKKEYFDEYCSIIFSNLFELEKLSNISEYDFYQQRVYGFLAERMANAYVEYAKEKYSNLKVNSLGLVSIYPFSNKGKINKNEEFIQLDNNINVCMAFDDKYLYHGMVAILSMCDNFRSNKGIKLFILCSNNLSELSRKLIKDEFDDRIVIEFCDVDSEIFKNFPLNRKHININTYFRLIIDQILLDIDKVIYIDADVVVYGNIAELWQIDLGENMIAGSLDEGGVSQSRRLKLPPESNYINAGVLLLNLKSMRGKYDNLFSEYCKTYISNQDKIILQDQDILNIFYDGSIKILDLRWNINSRIFSQNTLERKYSQDDELVAVNNAGIIHYTDSYKPWTFFCSHPYAGLYWKYRMMLSKNTMLFSEHMARLNNKYFNFSYTVTFNKIVFEFLGLKISTNKKLLKSIIGRR